MNAKKAKDILAKAKWTYSDDGGFYHESGKCISWEPGYSTAIIDAALTADVLEAIAWWMRNAGEGKV